MAAAGVGAAVQAVGIALDQTLRQQQQIDLLMQEVLRLNQQRNPLLLATPKRIAQLIAAGWSTGAKLRVWVHGERLGVALARRLITRSSEVWTLYTVPGAVLCPALH